MCKGGLSVLELRVALGPCGVVEIVNLGNGCKILRLPHTMQFYSNNATRRLWGNCICIEDGRSVEKKNEPFMVDIIMPRMHELDSHC